MKAVFVESSIFEKHRSDYMSDDEYSAFQRELLSEPVKGDVIQGTGGLRKIRVSAKGKRGGARVIYYYFDLHKVFKLFFLGSRQI